MVADHISNGQWTLPRTDDSNISRLWAQISSIPIFPELQDQVIWRQTKNGFFSLMSAYHSHFTDNDVNWWKLIWSPWCIPKHSFIAWLATRGRLKTRAFLVAIGINSISVNCVHCPNEETSSHIILNYSHSQKFWKAILDDLIDNDLLMGSVENFAVQICSSTSDANICKFMAIAFTTTIYYIWKQRNGIIFQHKSTTDDQVISSCKNSIQKRLFFHNVHLPPQLAAKWSISYTNHFALHPLPPTNALPPCYLVLKAYKD